MGLQEAERLFRAGIVIMAAALTAAVIALIIMGIRKRRLDRQLDLEFGEKRK